MDLGSSRELAVLMFTDMVGSTAFRQSQGERRAEEVREAIDETHIDLAAGHGGAIVKHLGDGMMLTFRSASAALSCAAGLHSEMRRLSSRFNQPVHLRIGISIGDVAVKDGDYFGMAVIEAGRLCSQAGQEQVLVSDAVHAVVRGDSVPQLVSPTPIVCKGIDEPVIAWQLDWDVPVETPELPLALQGDQLIGFVGREAEFSALLQAWKEAQGGALRLAVIAGEAGLGKTRLAAHVAARAHAEGGLVLYGHDDEDLLIPYQSFFAALRQFIENEPATTLSRRLGRQRGELVRLVPELADMVPDLPPPTTSEPETERYLLFEAVVQWLSSASSVQPLVLVLDDMHWASRPTFQLLRHIMMSPAPLRLLVIVTTRDTLGTDTPINQLLAQLAPRSTRRIGLTPFDEGTIYAFLESAAGHDLGVEGRPVSKFLLGQSGGNPLFAREIMLHLIEFGAFERRNGRWTLVLDPSEAGLPVGIQQVVAERVGRLPDATQRVLSWASVIGQRVDVGLVGAVSELGDDQLLDAIDQCERAGLLHEEGANRFAFTHALVRDALYSAMGPTRQLLAHRRIASTIEAMDEPSRRRQLNALAYHFDEGSDGTNVDRAVHYRRLAGDQALEQLAADEAVAHYERALSLLALGQRSSSTAETERIELLTSLGSALMYLGDARFTEVFDAACEGAIAIQDGVRLATALLAATPGAGSQTGTVNTTRVVQMEQAVLWLPEGDSPLRSRVLAAMAAELHYSGDIDRTAALSDEALAMARRCGDQSTLGEVLTFRLAALRWTETLNVRRSDAIELERMARSANDPQVAFFAAYRRADIEIELADGAGFLEALTAAGQILHGTSLPYLDLNLQRLRVEQALLSGELGAAKAMLDGMWAKVDELGIRRARFASYTGITSKVLQARGEAEQSIALWEELRTSYPEIGGLALGLAVAYRDTGQRELARDLYEKAAADGFAGIRQNVATTNNLCMAAVLCGEFGSNEEADALTRRLMPYRHLIAHAGSAAYGAVEQFLGLLAARAGRLDDALTHYDAATEMHERLGAPLLEAYNDIARAVALTQRDQPGDRERARAVIDRAVAVAERCEAAGIVQLLRRQLPADIDEVEAP